MTNPKWQQIKGKWNQFQGSARERWGELTDNELAEARGERDQLIGMVQESYGISREEARDQVDKWAEEAKGAI